MCRTGRAQRKRKAWQKILLEHGYAARTLPKEYGGYGAARRAEKPDYRRGVFARQNARRHIRSGHQHACADLLELGTEEQKQKYIEPTLTGEMVWCQGYSNPVPGLTLPLAHLGGFGGRSFCGQRPKNMDQHGSAGRYDFCLVRTEPDAPKHQGISYLLFSMDTPGKCAL